MQAEKFWDNNAEKYAASAVRDEAVYQEKLRLTQQYLQPEHKVIEFGCGTGTTALHHASFVHHILGTDISSKMVDIARQKARDANVTNVEFAQATVESFEADPESFDAVLALNLLHLLPDPQGAVAKMYTLLKPGGVFVSGTACLGDVIISPYRVLIPVMRLFGRIPPVQYLKRKDLLESFEQAGFEVVYQMPQRKGQAAFIICRKPG